MHVSEPRLISPMLDNFMMGGPISDHHGVCCCPAMENGTNDRYIVKVISIPATPAQMDAMLLSGAFFDEESALKYYRELTDEVLREVDALEKLSELEWFIPFKACQMETMESGKGYEIYLLADYNRTLQKHFNNHIFTHLDALNLGLDLCSALSMSRRNGYLYVDLKPNNIFVADQRLFRIGDLGFISLDSLKYTSLPEKYQSIYTAPEVRDAFSALNTTIDIYAAGLILYQAYNNGELPFNNSIKPGDQFPAPLYADYEISEIILKACAVNPEDRWQDPAEMRQAIVNYMQRNGALDIPIVPIPSSNNEEEIEEKNEIIVTDEVVMLSENADGGLIDNNLPIDLDNEQQPNENEALEEPQTTAEDTETEINDDVIDSEKDLDENIDDTSIFTDEDIHFNEEDLGEHPADYAKITDEVSDMLDQADELAAMDVPDPVVVPEHVDIPEPDPIQPEIQETVEDTTVQENTDEQTEEEFIDSDSDFEEDIENVPNLLAPLKRIHWVRNAIIVVILIVLLGGGFYYYKNHYLIPIEYISVEGNENSLTVFITTEIDESLLEVICSDTYGNKSKVEVVDGKAVFTDLIPNSAYSIKVKAKGFHKLTGKASTAYSTPIQTNIVQFDAIAGMTEDSVILSFTAEGPGSDTWTVEYTAEGEEAKHATFIDSQMVTITNLTVGKTYKFRLVPKQPLYLTGQTEISFTPSKLIRAENLYISSCTNNKLTVTWSAPEGQPVSGWSVRCHNETYNRTIITTDTTVTFEELDHNKGFDIEIKAIGMSISSTISLPANSITASDFIIDTTDPSTFTLSWNPSKPIPEDGWIVCYTVVGLGSEKRIPCSENKANIGPLVPNAIYEIHIEDAKGNALLGSHKTVTAPSAQAFRMEFQKFTLTTDDLTFKMLKTPSKPNWGRYDVPNDYYTNTFTVGQSASFLVRSQKDCYVSDKLCAIMFVIRNQNGEAILYDLQERIWTDMWNNYNCKMEIPTMPTEAGTYNIEIYFNGGLAHKQEFIIQ